MPGALPVLRRQQVGQAQARQDGRQRGQPAQVPRQPPVALHKLGHAHVQRRTRGGQEARIPPAWCPAADYRTFRSWSLLKDDERRQSCGTRTLRCASSESPSDLALGDRWATWQW